MSSVAEMSEKSEHERKVQLQQSAFLRAQIYAEEENRTLFRNRILGHGMSEEQGAEAMRRVADRGLKLGLEAKADECQPMIYGMSERIANLERALETLKVENRLLREAVMDSIHGREGRCA